jgi:hypothetical protein
MVAQALPGDTPRGGRAGAWAGAASLAHPLDAGFRRNVESGKPVEIGAVFAAGNPCRIIRELVQ